MWNVVMIWRRRKKLRKNHYYTEFTEGAVSTEKKRGDASLLWVWTPVGPCKSPHTAADRISTSKGCGKVVGIEA
jgi:hypothetical protein